MDTARGFEDAIDIIDDTHDVATHDAAPPPEIGTDERRMHVRAYNHWVSLLDGRAYPSIEDLEPERIADFGQHSVLLDFTAGVEDPTVQFLGTALRAECGLDGSITRIADVPSRSLLSRLTDHYLQIIANRAPIGFEAEFVGQRGYNTLYRGILMPFSSDGDTIDFIYGVINWKELVDAATQARLDAEVDAAVRAAPAAAPAPAPVWADGPSAGLADDPVEDDPVDDDPVDDAGLAAQLMLARESAAQVRAADTRSRAALYRALGRAHDFAIAADADPAGYATLLADAGLSVQARAPMTPIAKLVFGADYDKTRLTEFAAVLAQARRTRVGRGGLAGFLDGQPGGIKAMVAAERAERRPDATRTAATTIAALRGRRSVADLPFVADDEFVILVARREGPGRYGVVGRLPARAATERLLSRTV